MRGRVILVESSKGMWVDTDEYRACLRGHDGVSLLTVRFILDMDIEPDYKVTFIPLELI